MKKTLIIISIFVSIISCKNKINREDLYGTYVFNMWNKDTIIIKPNNSYIYKTLKNDSVALIKGKWLFNSKIDEITLEGLNFTTKVKSNGYWTSKIKIINGKEILMYASDINAYFEKID